MNEVIVTGKTVEDATEKGCKELGRAREDVTVEILEMPVRRFFKSIPAKVRVALLEELRPVEKPIEKPKKIENKTIKKPEKPPVKFQKEQEKKVRTEVLSKEPEEEIDIEANASAKRAVAYLKEFFAVIGAEDVKISAFKQGEATLIKIEGEDIINHIETRGETVQALSYLTDRTVNRGIDKRDPEYIRVRLDVAGYRDRREKELVVLANRTAQEVLQTKKSRTLAPMNPYERLIIHTTIAEIEGVVSDSFGSDNERRVVVKSTAADAKNSSGWEKKPRSKGGYTGNRKGSGRTGTGNSGGYKSQKSYTPEREFVDKKVNTSKGPIVPDKREEVKDGKNLPLYGKIDI